MYKHCIGWLAFAASFSTGWTSTQASPISYAFSGTLAQPFNGSSQFSGTFTYDTDLPPYPGITGTPGWSYYSGVPADPSEPVLSLTFTLGNTPSSSFGQIEMDSLVVEHTSGGDGFFIQETFSYAGGQNLWAEFGMSSNNLVSPAPFTSSNPPTSLNLADFSGANLVVQGTTSGGQQLDVVGTVTSLVPLGGNQMPVPEPGSFLVFVVMGAGLWGYLRRRGRSRN
jgi:hypothetical protein